MQQQSCQTIEVCDAFCDTLIDLVGEKIQMIEVDKLRQPCAAAMSIKAASLLANLSQ